MNVIEGTIASPKGFHADGQHVGLKHKAKDLGWIYSEVPAQVAAVFTTNQVKAAPITVTKQAILDGTLQAIVVNSGNANACTGKQGIKDAKTVQHAAAEKLGLKSDAVAVASTGVIGKPLPVATVVAGLDQLSANDGDNYGFHQAILTTDKTTKEITVTEKFGDKTVTVAGVAKGSGMIHPNMATMLSFVTTDAAISAATLHQLLKEITDVTFNQITIDGDTSTNDMAVVMANGLAGNPEITTGTAEYETFKELLKQVCQTLAQKIAQDGEGATKLIEVVVKRATNGHDARMIAKKIVGSTLVKTAIFGQDPNWGRIICATGYAGAEIDPMSIDIFLGDIEVLHQGQPQEFNTEDIKNILAKPQITITIDLHLGEEQGTAWGCDLSYDYVKINALYST